MSTSTHITKTPVNPYVIVKDVDQALDFYQKAFGFVVTEKVPGDDGSTEHSETTFANQMVMFGKAGAWGGTSIPPSQSGTECPISLCLSTKDVDAFYAHAINHGAKSVSKPEDTFWGARMCRLGDHDGYIWCIYAQKE